MTGMNPRIPAERNEGKPHNRVIQTTYTGRLLKKYRVTSRCRSGAQPAWSEKSARAN
jgi:hypothetical protein